VPAEFFADRSRSTLAVACTAAATTLTVVTPAQEFPVSYPYRVICGTEIMRVTARAGNVLTVTRGLEGTAAAAHAAGAIVAHGATAGALNDMRADITAGAVGPAGVGVPVGGATGQALIKASAANYDTAWGTVAGGGTATYTKHTEILVSGGLPTDQITAADLGPDPIYAGHDFIYAEVTN